MNLNMKLHEYMLDKAWDLTEEWYTTINEEETGGVYLSDEPDAVARLKEQNNAFHKYFADIFIKPEEDFMRNFADWVMAIVHDEGHLQTPSYMIAEEFFRTQRQYMILVDEFTRNCEECTQEDANRWKDIVGTGIGKVISWFLKEQNKYESIRNQKQQQTINKLTSPIITLNRHVALLPLIGKIDDERAAFMLENTLEACNSKEVRTLLIDLSGVVTVDTMVSHQIFQLIDALDLIGVGAVLSGIRPEIAQMAVEHGDRFGRMTIVSNLEKAIDMFLK